MTRCVPHELDSRAKSRRVQENNAEAEQVTQACCNGFLTQTEALKVQTDTFFWAAVAVPSHKTALCST